MASPSEALAIAIQHHQAGRLQAAEQIYRQILQADPNEPDALHLLGGIAHQVGKHELALEYMSRAIAFKGKVARFHDNLAKVYAALRRFPEAIACYRRALELKPDSADVHVNLGNLFKKEGKLDEAMTCYRQALELAPEMAEAHNNLGNAFMAQRKPEEAVACFHRALDLKPDFAVGHNNLGNAWKDLGQLDEAAASYRRALELSPDLAWAHNNLGLASKDQGNLDQAVASCRRALELDPDFAWAHNNLGLAFVEQGRMEEAGACFRRALELNPDFAEAHYNLGLFLLRLGCYEEGWREHEYRLQCSREPRKEAKPRWKGERAVGRTILIQSEQGFGDALQFVRYAKLVRERAVAQRVILETHPSLTRLFTQNGGWDAEIAPGANSESTALPPYDCHIPLLSLPLALGLFDPLPMTGAYVYADPELRRTWRDRLGAAPMTRVGLVWAGNPGHKLDRLRSMPPEGLQPLLRRPGFQFYSLQIGSPSFGAPALKEAGLIDLTMQISDFADTAAFIAELDLIISVDTAVAHLAGAMDRPVWTLLPFRADWRWGLAGDTTPWYPTMRLFRQPTAGDWDAVVQHVAAELSLGPFRR